MSLTRLRSLVVIAAVVGVLAWAVLRALDASGRRLPETPWSVPVVLGLLAGAVVLSAVALRRRLRGGVGVRAPDPLVAARMVALAKATSHAGAVLVGVYAGTAVYAASGDPSDLRRERALVTAAAAVACVLLVAAGLLLERVCRVDPPEDDSPPAAG